MRAFMQRRLLRAFAFGTGIAMGIAACAPAPVVTPASPGTAAPSAAPSAAGAAVGETYVIGVVSSVTGFNAPLGTPQRDTAQLMADVLQQSGGIMGPDGKKHPVKVAFYDDGSDETKAVTAFKRLIDEDKAAIIIGSIGSGATLAALPTVQQAGVPTLASAASTKISQPPQKWVFQLPQTDELAAKKVLGYLQKRNLKKIAVIHDNTALGTNGRDQLQKFALEYGVTLVMDESYAPDDKDMTPQLTRIRRTAPDAIAGWGTNPGPGIIVKNYQQLGLTMPVIFHHGAANAAFLQVAGDAGKGTFFAGTWMLVPDQIPTNSAEKPVVDEFLKLFRAKYQRDPDTFAGYTYDGIRLALQALQKVGPDRAKLRDYVEKDAKGFVGVTGEYNHSAQDHNGLSPQAMVIVKVGDDGKWKLESQ